MPAQHQAGVEINLHATEITCIKKIKEEIDDRSPLLKIHMNAAS
jgi:hypothetical protein